MTLTFEYDLNKVKVNHAVWQISR